MHANVACNSRNGDIYVIGHGLNGTISNSKGDVLKLVPGPTPGEDVWSTLIIGNNQGLNWKWPDNIVFRRGVATDGSEDTILVVFENDEAAFRPVREHYVSNGFFKANHDVGVAYAKMRMAQADRAHSSIEKDSVWFTCKSGQWRLAADDTISHFNDDTSDECFDIASPGVGGWPACTYLVYADADADEDGDVDQDDFAILQTCLTVGGGAISTNPAYCACFDRNSDSHVDDLDVIAFMACATGPSVPFNPSSPPLGCLP